MKTRNFIFILIIILGCKNTAEIKNSNSKENKKMQEQKKGKITGIGGIFFKCKDPKQMKEWYGNNFGFATDEYGSLFEFRKADNPKEKVYLQWSPFAENTKYFQPSAKDFMINYRVENIEILVNDLKQKGINVLDTIQTFDYGKFVHIMDPEGNKIELWEPIDSIFTK